MCSIEFSFQPPPECPVFRPSEDEFKDPLEYIARIKSVAENTGICKIIPPLKWRPPFALDVDNFKFIPRIQRLNELEALTRIKLNFLDKIARFWELQGSSLKLPTIDKKVIDLYTLHQHVQREGGLLTVNKEKKWQQIAINMGYPPNKCVGAILKPHYERILYPFDVFHEGKNLEEMKVKEEKIEKDGSKDYIPHSIPCRQAIKPPSDHCKRRSKRHSEDLFDSQNMELSNSENKELKRLKFYGAGPKMAGYHTAKQIFWESKSHINAKLKGRSKKSLKIIKGEDPLAKYICLQCNRGDDEESMLLCDGCDDSYHTFCLVPPLSEIPKGDWRCPQCLAREVIKPLESFGFEQAQREYTLHSFGEMADNFKMSYFNMPVDCISTETVEAEYWRILSAIDEDVTVEYGADLHTMDHGSGFPTSKSKNLNHADAAYAECPWNLNNLPVLHGSVLSHIPADISGMMVPWMYVGMCFATFCWHNEDHYSYSINYLHWGEPKTWYGLSGNKADLFEEKMRSIAPELFDSQPDLLHQLVTIMNPNLLMNCDIPIYRTDQKAGEFVITFPRSYHAGFNQGFNFAEAVNFAPPDWLYMGRLSVEHYSKLHRYCVFSHDELVCNISLRINSLTLDIASAALQDMILMVKTESQLRRELLEWGVIIAERQNFELLTDDERQCEVCKTTCFLSALTCSCTNKLVCLQHPKLLCSCSPNIHSLKYRYTLDELSSMLEKLQERVDSLSKWERKAKSFLQNCGQNKPTQAEFKQLLEEAEQKNIANAHLIQSLEQALEEAQKCSTVAQHLLAHQARIRTRGVTESNKVQITLEELQQFVFEMKQLACSVPETNAVQQLVDKTNEFELRSQQLLNSETATLEELQEVINSVNLLDVDLPSHQPLRLKLQRMHWLQKFNEYCGKVKSATIPMLRQLLDEGISLPPSSYMESQLAHLQMLLTKAEGWEDVVSKLLQSKTQIPLSVIENLLSQSKTIPVNLCHLDIIEEAPKKYFEWEEKLKIFWNSSLSSYLEDAESLKNKNNLLLIQSEELAKLQSVIEKGKNLKEKIANLFLNKGSSYTLIEILCPRISAEIIPFSQRVKHRKQQEEKSSLQQLNDILNNDCSQLISLASIEKAYMEMSRKEIDIYQQIRNDTPSRICFCGKPTQIPSMFCQICNQSCHVSCVDLPEPYVSQQRHAIRLNHLKFFCPFCKRSLRPALSKVSPIIDEIDELPIKLIEGELLRLLINRATNWQKQVTREFKKISSQDNSLFAKVESEDLKFLGTDGAGEHAYSAIPYRIKQSRKSQLIPREFDISPPSKIEKIQILQDLILEGDLLEIAMDEEEFLWQMFLDSVAEDKEEFPLLTDIEKIKKKRRKTDGFRIPKVSHWFANRRSGFKKTKKELLDLEDGEVSGYEEEKCAAANCLTPIGEEVDWVQCDGGCEGWYHLICLGLQKNDLKEDKDYICPECYPKAIELPSTDS